MGWSLRAGWLAGAGLATCLALVPIPSWSHPEREFLEQAVREELGRAPGDPELLMRQARLREMARDWDGALSQVEHARAHGADPAAVAAARGRILLAAGRPRRALAAYERALALRPDAFETMFARGRAHLALGDAARADHDFARAIARMREPRPEHVIARRDALLARGRRAAAVDALDAGIARLGPIATLVLPAVELDVQLGHYERALGRLDRLVEHGPANAVWIARRADVLMRAGRRDEARAAYAQALALLDRRGGRRRPGVDAIERRIRAELADQEDP